MLNFAVIAPTTLLPKYAGGRRVQFCLAQYCDRQDYLDFYRKCVLDGSTVILDNGAYEGKLMDFDDLAQVALELQPTVMVLPDVIGDRKLTTYLHKAFRSYWHANYRWNELEWDPVFMSVPHGEDIWNLIEVYRHVPDGEWVGFSRGIDDYSGCTRLELVRRLRQVAIWEPRRIHHALGMRNGDCEELRQLAIAGINSCDSSAPVWRAISASDGLDMDWEGVEYQFRPKIQLNLSKVDQAAKGRA